MGRATLLLHLGLPAETCSIFAPKPHHVAELQQDLPYVCAAYPRLHPATMPCLAAWLFEIRSETTSSIQIIRYSSGSSSQQFQDSFGPCFFGHPASSSGGRLSSSSSSRRGFFDGLARFDIALVCSQSCNTPFAEASRKPPSWYGSKLPHGYGCSPPDVSSSLCFFRLHLPAPEVLPLSSPVFIIVVFITILLSFFRSRYS